LYATGTSIRGRLFTWTAVLVGVGILLTFQTFFQLFAPEE
jgi:hypothetical protein